MLIGRPEPLFVCLLALAVLAVVGLTVGFTTTPPRPQIRRFVTAGITVTWVVVSGMSVGVAVGALMPRLIVVPLFVLAGRHLLVRNAHEAACYELSGD
jgi:hypothetical protein